jgi:nucleotide-binding universal stress UspA family protein
MKLLQQILVPVDFGPRTDAVVEAAASIARTFGSQIHVLHVLPSLDEASPETREIVDLARQEAARRLAEIRSRLEQAGLSTAEQTVATGSPFDQIIRHADELDVNVIVVGSRKDGGPDGPQLGTTLERLCRKASKPVWIVAPTVAPTPQTILCPVDCSPASARALRNGIHLARRFEARLVVLYVVTPINFPVLIPSVQEGMQQKYLESESVRLDRFLERFEFHGVEWERHVRQGSPAETILEAAAGHSAELLVMGSVGRTGLSRILLGSVAAKVARRMPSSMVLMKAEDAIRLKVDEELTDLDTHYARGCELMANGFLEEARRQFSLCLRTNDLFVPAWDGLAESWRRQGDAARAEEFRQTAERIEKSLEWQRVEADIRRSHNLWKGFGGVKA